MPTPPAFTWKQVVASESPEQFSVSGSETAIQMVIDVDNHNFDLNWQEVFGQILGWPRYEPNSPVSTWKLRRNLPWRHPFVDWATALKIISVRGRGQPGRNSPPTGPNKAHQYPTYRMTIQFGIPPYAVLGDQDIAGLGDAREFYRFTEKSCDLGVDSIMKKGSRFSYAKVLPTTTGNGGLPPGVPANDTLDLGIIRQIGKAHLRWTWHAIPGKALFGDYLTTIPTNIFAGMGRLNDAPFPDANGYAKGTLLCLPPKIIPEDAPVHPSLLGMSPGYPPRLFRVEYNIAWLDPDVDPNWNGAGNAYPYRGHNLVPPQTAASNQYWYLGTSAGPALDNSPADQYQLYKYYDFTKLFQLP